MLRLKLAGLLPILNERQRRVLAAAEAQAYGRGGVQTVSLITGISRPTIYRGIAELGDHSDPERVRKTGGGRKKMTLKYPDLVSMLEQLIEPGTRGDPESPLRWTCKSLSKLTEELDAKGFELSRPTVASILHDLDYSLQANRKTSEGKADHPDRDAQFRYINRRAKLFLRDSRPVISVDTKKKELVGNYKNGGREWRRKGSPIKVLSVSLRQDCVGDDSYGTLALDRFFRCQRV